MHDIESTYSLVKMRFAYVMMLLLMSITTASCYNQRPFNPQKKKPFVASKVKISKPYVSSKGPRSNLPYKSESKTPKVRNPNKDNQEESPLWQELLEGDR